MVATSLAKLSKEKKASITLSGKRDEVRSWLFVFEDTLDKVFGYEIIPRLLRPANNNPEASYDRTEFATYPLWFQEYVMAVNRELYTIILNCIVRGTPAGETLMADIMASADQINKSGSNLAKFIAKGPNNLSEAECKIVLSEIKAMKLHVRQESETLARRCGRRRAACAPSGSACRRTSAGPTSSCTSP
jgi:hypothetical protein